MHSDGNGSSPLLAASALMIIAIALWALLASGCVCVATTLCGLPPVGCLIPNGVEVYVVESQEPDEHAPEATTPATAEETEP